MSVLDETDPLEIEEYLRLIRGQVPDVDDEGNLVNGRPPLGETTAAFAVNWTPRKLKALKREPEFVALVHEARTQLIESVETLMFRAAFMGRQKAMELILFCQAADRGWRPPTQRHVHEGTGQVEHSVVISVTQAAREMLANADIRALQEANVIDGEVVEGD
jgi:hypothetical protein